MSDSPQDEVSESTQSAEHEDEQVHAGADRMPTPEEEAAADALPPLDPKVAENYEHAAELGAHIKGEGQVD
jgi:hypothetical protein